MAFFLDNVTALSDQVDTDKEKEARAKINIALGSGQYHLAVVLTRPNRAPKARNVKARGKREAKRSASPLVAMCARGDEA